MPKGEEQQRVSQHGGFLFKSNKVWPRFAKSASARGLPPLSETWLPQAARPKKEVLKMIRQFRWVGLKLSFCSATAELAAGLPGLPPTSAAPCSSRTSHHQWSALLSPSARPKKGIKD